jgi:hypothetical protein
MIGSATERLMELGVGAVAGAKTPGIASFHLRAGCQNRNLWRVGGFDEITIRQSKYAASRFANSSPQPLINGVKAARSQIVANTDNGHIDCMRKRGLSKGEATKIIKAVLAEDGHPPTSVFDFVHGITAVTRRKTPQDARLEFEGRAKKQLDRVGGQRETESLLRDFADMCCSYSVSARTRGRHAPKGEKRLDCSAARFGLQH